MPTEVLSGGGVYTLNQNQVYALPSIQAYIIASAALEFSMLSGSGFASVPASATGMFSAYPFCRSTAVGTVVSVKLA